MEEYLQGSGSVDLGNQIKNFVNNSLILSKEDLPTSIFSETKIRSTFRRGNLQAESQSFDHRFCKAVCHLQKGSSAFFVIWTVCAKIINNPERPVQFLFAGKAHPADKAGQDLIKLHHRHLQKA